MGSQHLLPSRKQSPTPSGVECRVLFSRQVVKGSDSFICWFLFYGERGTTVQVANHSRCLHVSANVRSHGIMTNRKRRIYSSISDHLCVYAASQWFWCFGRARTRRRKESERNWERLTLTVQEWLCNEMGTFHPSSELAGVRGWRVFSRERGLFGGGGTFQAKCNEPL